MNTNLFPSSRLRIWSFVHHVTRDYFFSPSLFLWHHYQIKRLKKKTFSINFSVQKERKKVLKFFFFCLLLLWRRSIDVPHFNEVNDKNIIKWREMNTNFLILSIKETFKEKGVQFLSSYSTISQPQCVLICFERIYKLFFFHIKYNFNA